ncbi:M20 family metallo-hydrolase (plasmid) [Rhodococcus pyridinivorans]|uniref:M20 family metallo-hydrolase n=1 Tax=Rhodococcus pyridinivorans TaxID=103816 RepID=UPI0020C6B9C3|nr:M20 family metallo-hydrolase [Rhodococcus pyridinivorans]UTM39801.1 M20 family metallo-hydrolase [Rhodococcus pyridinivorans]
MPVFDPLTIAEPEHLTAALAHLSTIVDSSVPGWTRQALTEADVVGRHWVKARMAEAGLDVHMDGAGNVIGVLHGTAPGNSAIMTGSHTDTVEGGGRYDGNVGVASAIEVARTLRANGVKLRHDLIVVDFFSEEPNRFGISCVGSRAMAGFITAQDLDRVDSDGVKFADELARSAIDPSALLSAQLDTNRIKAFVELHIEQGPYLEEQGSDIGLVTSITGIKRFRVAFKGRPDHAGTTPMNRRHDAGCAAAGSVLAIEQIASANVDGRGTTGLVTFTPDAVNIVTESAELWGEFRSPDLRWLEDAGAEFHSAAQREGANRSVEVQLDWLPSERPAGMDDRFIDITAREADRLGLSQSRLYSGAEHDAAIIAKKVPTAMIFVPSKDGRSHCPDEFTAEKDIHSGANVLLNTIITLDRELDFD